MVVDFGVNCWFIVIFYGFFIDFMVNFKLIRVFFDKYFEYIFKVVLIVKGGMDVRLWFFVKGDE